MSRAPVSHPSVEERAARGKATRSKVLCGDAHLSNFGGFASPSRELVFDINDFDETARGPYASSGTGSSGRRWS